MRLRNVIVALVFGLCLSAGACDDPMATRDPFPDESLMVVMVLNPDTAEQYMLLLPLDAGGDIVEPTAEVWRDGILIAEGGPAPDFSETTGETSYCTAAFGTMNRPGGEKRCLLIPFQPQPGATYEVVVEAVDRPTARAETTIPGAFEVLDFEATGDPPGTDRLLASWTRSSGADRYFVAVHADHHPKCLVTCEDLVGGGKNLGWYESVRDTTISTRVEADVLAGAEGAWYLEIVALDEALAAHLTSGVDAHLFPVPPMSNVRGGVGFVGSWVTRKIPLEP